MADKADFVRETPEVDVLWDIEKLDESDLRYFPQTTTRSSSLKRLPLIQ